MLALQQFMENCRNLRWKISKLLRTYLAILIQNLFEFHQELDSLALLFIPLLIKNVVGDGLGLYYELDLLEA